VPAASLAGKPTTLDHVETAALPIAGLTALQALAGVAQVRPGQRVLIHGGAGGVGHFAVQIAKDLGAYVIATARAEKHSYLRELGADELVDYTRADFGTLRDFDVVLDTVSGEYGPRSLPTLVPGGVLVDVVGIGVDRTAVVRQADSSGRRFVEFYLQPSAADLIRLASVVDRGALRPSIQCTLPLIDAAKAHELSEGRRVQGKVVLTP
jgi:NADPH:quinone reductase-like Zn-dependent oxidoreductase